MPLKALIFLKVHGEARSRIRQHVAHTKSLRRAVDGGESGEIGKA